MSFENTNPAFVRWLLSNIDPGWDSYWIVDTLFTWIPNGQTTPQSRKWQPGDRSIVVNLYTRTVENTAAAQSTRILYRARDIAAPSSPWLALTRFNVAASNLGDLDRVASGGEPSPQLIAAHVYNIVQNPNSHPTYAVSKAFRTTPLASAPVPGPYDMDGFSVSINFSTGTHTQQVFEVLPPRKPRKWGRVLTPKWEAEHAQIVAARKFKRNAKRAKEGKLPRRQPTPDEVCNAKSDARAYQVKLAALGTLDSAVKRIKHAGRRAAARKVQRQVAHRLAKIRAPRK
jgi:hypothetical protein